MDKILMFVIGVLLVAYLLQPVPICKQAPIEELTTKEIKVSYSEEDIKEIEEKLDGAMIVHTIGDSMNPTIKHNDQCLCKKKDSYEIGDIIGYKTQIENKWQLITHRIIKEDNGIIYTKGDKNIHTDPPITKEQIICSIPEVERWRLR